jgi:hypothetical protein
MVQLRPVHKLLHKKLRIPQHLVRPVLSRIKVAASRGEHAERLALAREIQRSSPHASSIPEPLGYLRFEADAFSGIAAAIGRCEELFERFRDRDPESERRAGFLRGIASGYEVTLHPELLALMVSRPLVDAVTGYLGCVPLLSAAELLWSPVNETSVSSQRFHLDDEDDRQVKLFLNVREVTSDNGPLTFLPADASAKVRARTGTIIARASDERVLGAAEAEPIRICGGPGSGVLVDTGRCLHYGSRRNTKERLVLSFQYLRDDAPSEPPVSCRFPVDLLAGLRLDPVQRLVLGLPAD